MSVGSPVEGVDREDNLLYNHTGVVRHAAVVIQASVVGVEFAGVGSVGENIAVESELAVGREADLGVVGADVGAVGRETVVAAVGIVVVARHLATESRPVYITRGVVILYWVSLMRVISHSGCRRQSAIRVPTMK